MLLRDSEVAKDERVETGLVDDGRLLCPTDGVSDPCSTVLISIQAGQGVVNPDTEDVAHVLRHEPRVPVPLDDAEVEALTTRARLAAVPSEAP